MPSIFISYRRADTRPFTERIHDRLVLEFGAENVFLDVDNNIPAGSNFPDVLMSSLNQSYVTLLIIGTEWLDIREHDNPELRRLDNPDDFVRIEVENSLKHPFVTVIPVLVDGSKMPLSSQLPESMQALAHIQARLVRHNPDFHSDMTDLIQQIRKEIDKNIERQNHARLEQERLEQQEQARLEQEKLTKEEQHQREKLIQLGINTQYVLDLLNISKDVLDANRRRIITADQQKQVKNLGDVSNTTSLVWINIILAVFSWVFWLAFGRFIEKSFWSPIFCVGVFLLVVIFIFYMVLDEYRQKRRIKIQHIKGNLLNVHLTKTDLAFTVATEQFTIDNTKIYKQMRELEDIEVSVYYIKVGLSTILLSMEITDDNSIVQENLAESVKISDSLTDDKFNLSKTSSTTT